jgi:predicted DNA-binding transcriptional regulator YafY
MPTNKHATIRYHALDQCFANFGRKYFINDLIDACNNALYEFNGLSDGIKRRQIFDDIRFMESEQGWTIPLVRHSEGKRVYYRYFDKNYSIKKQAINESEANQLKETLSILHRFKGMPHFEWIDEILVRLASSFNLNKTTNPSIVGFEQNQYLKGLDFFGALFNAILYKKSLNIDYQSFNKAEPVLMEIHPYYLKQYNNRWFLIGLNPHYQKLSNIALDRILHFVESNTPYISNENIDFEAYFEDAIGVSVDGREIERVILKIARQTWPYIETKPIHGSQKVLERNENEVMIELHLKINFELETLLLSRGEAIEVISPEYLRNRIKERVNALQSKYL